MLEGHHDTEYLSYCTDRAGFCGLSSKILLFALMFYCMMRMMKVMRVSVIGVVLFLIMREASRFIKMGSIGNIGQAGSQIRLWIILIFALLCRDSSMENCFKLLIFILENYMF